MVTGYTNYKAEVKNVKFIADDGRTCARTAIITLHDEEGEEIGNELFGAIDTNQIFSLIKEGKDLNLDNFYVTDFSLSSYRRYNGMDKKALVEIKGFSARNALFDAKVSTDFSFASFADGDISFEGTHFCPR